MLTTILRSNTIAAFVLAYVLGAAMLLFSLLVLPQNELGNGLLYAHWAFGWLKNSPALLPYISVVLVVVAAVLVRIRPGETRKALGSSNLSLVAFMALIMVNSHALARPDVLAATLFLSAIMLLLFSTYKQESVLSQVFHVGLLLGVTALFVGSGIFLLLAVILSILILRTGNIKEWAVLVLGLAMTAVFIFMFAIWAQNPLLAFQRVLQSGWFADRSVHHLNAGHMLLIPVIFISLWGMLTSLAAANVVERTIALATVVWVLCIFLMVLLFGLGWQNGLIVAAFPLSAFIGKTFDNTKRWWLAELMLLLLLAAPFVSTLWQL